MKAPEEDIEDRLQIWNVFQIFWLDTMPSDNDWLTIVKTCKESKYTNNELELIFMSEMFPAMRWILGVIPVDPVPDWCPYNLDYLKEKVLNGHKFGGKPPWYMRKYAKGCWAEISSRLLQDE